MKLLGNILLCLIVALVLILLFGRAVDHELNTLKPKIGTALVCHAKGNRIWCGNPNSKRARVKRPPITIDFSSYDVL